MKVRYLGHSQTIVVGGMRRRIKPGDVFEIEDPEKALRDKMGRKTWEEVAE